MDIHLTCDVKHTTSVVQAKINYERLPDTHKSEFVFRFPLDEGCAVFEFVAQIGNKRLVAEIQEREEAKATYERALEGGHTALLMNQDVRCDDEFFMRLGHMPVGEQVVISLKYISPLERLVYEDEPSDQLCHCLRLPSVLNPRYNPDMQKSSSKEGVSLSKLEYKFSFVANVQSHYSILSVSSGNEVDKFSLNFEKRLSEDRHAIIRLLGGEVRAKRMHDLAMRIHCKVDMNQRGVPLSLYEMGRPELSSDVSNELLTRSDVIQVEFTPDFSALGVGRAQDCHEFIFVVDRSGSMGGASINCASDALLILLKSLPSNCFFQIVGFGSTFDTLFPVPSEYNEANLERALDYQRTLEANMGGTEIFPALKSVYEKSLAPQAESRKIFIMTDGDVTNPDQVISLVRKFSVNSQLFAIGIGRGASSALVKGLARVGQGRAVFVNDGDKKLSGQLVSLVKSSITPAIANVTFEMQNLPPGVSFHSIPDAKSFPMLISGVTFCFYVFLKGFTENEDSRDVLASRDCRILLRGKLGGATPTEYQIRVEPPSQSLRSHMKEINWCATDFGVLHRFAARKHVQSLTDLQDNDSNRNEIISVSKAFNLISRYTSFVAVDMQSKSSIPFFPPEPPKLLRMACPSGARMRMMCSSPNQRMAFGCSGPSSNLEVKEKSRSPAQPKSFTCTLAAHSTMQGFWRFTPTLVAELKLKFLDGFNSTKPDSLNQDQWLTVVILAYLEAHCLQDKDEWEMIAEKAELWLLSSGAALDTRDKLKAVKELACNSLGKMFA